MSKKAEGRGSDRLDVSGRTSRYVRNLGESLGYVLHSMPRLCSEFYELNEATADPWYMSSNGSLVQFVLRKNYQGIMDKHLKLIENTKGRAN